MQARLEPGRRRPCPSSAGTASRRWAAPGPHAQARTASAIDPDLDRARSVGRHGSANRRSRRNAHRRVAGTAHERPEHEPQVDRPDRGRWSASRSGAVAEAPVPTVTKASRRLPGRRRAPVLQPNLG